MLIPAALFDGIREGEITVAFRSWKRPTIKIGGTLTTPAGVLAIDELEPITAAEITDDDARSAGAASAADVVADLRQGEDRTVYRIRFHRLGDDPRTVLRETADIPPDERTAIAHQLERWDRASRSGPWTTAVLTTIAEHPATQSGELAGRLGVERHVLKRRVRQLKSLGLTESLQTGYRLSPRGRRYLEISQRS